MAYKYREEIVGKRFLSVRSASKLKLAKISEWEWRAGVVRAVNHKDAQNPEVSNHSQKSSTVITRDHEVLVEFDDVKWNRREWIRIFDVFQVFLVENTLLWALRPEPGKTASKVHWPSLNFKPIVDKVGIYGGGRSKPLEFLVDHHLEFADDADLKVYREDDRSVANRTQSQEAITAARKWIEYQDSQQILLQTPSVLVGYCRAEVYRAEGTTQWYTAIINSYNENTRELSVTDDTVLEEHNVDPALVQIKLLDTDVVQSILRGEDLGVRPRKTRRHIQEAKRSSATPAPEHLTGDTGRSPVSLRGGATTRKSRAAKTGEASTPTATPPLTPSTPIEKDSIEVSTPKVKNTQKSTPKRKLEDRSSTPIEDKGEKSDSRKTPSPQKRAKPSDNTSKAKEKNPSDVTLEQKDSTPNANAKSREASTPVRQQKALRDKPDKGKNKPHKEPAVGKNKRVSPVVKENKERRKNNKKANSAPSAKPSQDLATEHPSKSGTSTADSNIDEVSTPVSGKQQNPTQGSKSLSQVVRKDSDSVKKCKREKKEKAKDNQEVPESPKVKEKKPKKEKVAKEKKVKEKPAPKKAEPETKGKKKEKAASVVQEKLIEPLSEPTKAPESEKVEPPTLKEEVDVVEEGKLEAKPEPVQTPELVSVKEKESKPSDDASEEKGKNAKEKLKPSKKSSQNTKKGKNKPDESGTMHFKKIHLLNQHKREGGSQEREKENGGQSSSGISSSGIDLNHSVTDQIAKRGGVKHGNEPRWEAPHPEVSPASSIASSHGATPYGNSDPPSRSYPPAAESRPAPHRPSHGDKAAAPAEDKPYSAGSSSSASREHNNNHHHDGGDVTIAHTSDSSKASRSSSRASEEHRPNSSSSLSNPRMEELRHPASKDSDKGNAASPLVFDKTKPVEPYRDPELLKKHEEMMKKDSEYRRMQMLQQAAVASSRPASHTPVPPHTSSYPTVRTPVAPPHAPHQLLTPMPTYPPHNLSPQVQLPPHLSQPSVDRLSLIHQQQQAQAALHLQQMQHVLQQQTHLVSGGYPTLHNTLTRQLEMLWQQKYPTLAVPPAWMLLQYQEELLRDVSLLQQRDLLERERRERELLERDRVEREIERERAERERAERERAERDRVERERAERERQERERQERERERQEREKLERERQERERQERERNEREKQERERKEKERMQHEQQQRIDRQRILLESAAAVDAVNQHFTESLRLASAKMSVSGTWNPTPSMPRPKPTPGMAGLGEGPSRIGAPGSSIGSAFSHVSPGHPSIHPDKKSEDKPSVSQHHMVANAQLQHQQQHQKMMMMRDGEGKPSDKMPSYYAPYAATNKPSASSGSSAATHPPASTAPSATAGSHVKSEPNFSLYGYQPFPPHMYISQDKLYQHGLKEEKGSVPKSEHHDIKHSPHSSHASPTGAAKKMGFASPPPLIKSEMHGKPSSVIVENKAKEARDSRDPGYHHPGGSITLGTASAQHGRGQPIKQEGHMTSSASPLCVASPRHLSQAMMQPMDLQKRSPGSSYPPTSHRSGEREGESQRGSSKGQPGPAIAQPPVSLPGSSASSHSFNLIQQGLVPNPIYTQTSQVNTKVASSESQQSSAHSEPSHQAGQQSSHPMLSPSSSQQQSYKRRPEKEASSLNSRKKTKVEGGSGPASAGSAGTSSSAPQNLTGLASSTSVTYMDSFRSFVENAVQSAFYQEQEMGGKKDGKNQTRPGTTSTTTVTKTQPTAQTAPSTSLPSSSAHFHSQPATSAPATSNSSTPFTPFPSLSSSVTRPGPASTPGGASVSSTSSIMETINRVANGFVDTDSDTLSAPSPTPDIKTGENNNPSPLKLSGSATKFKKAWLQRYSDEDKKNTDNAENKTGESKNEKGDPVKDCYVNLSYISPTKDGGGKSPISMLKDLTSRKDEDSTSSASEMDSPGNDTSAKRRKPKRRSSTGSSSSKKIKLSGDESNQSTATVSSGKKRSRKGKAEKVEKVEKSPEKEFDEKEKEEPKEVKKEKSKPKEAPSKEKKYPKSDCEIKLEKKRKMMGEKGITTRDNPSTILAKKPLNKETHTKLKKTMDPFHQDGSCTEVTPKLMKCRECKMTPNQRNKNINVPNIFCRFYAFRRLKFSTKGFLTIAGFCQPSDADADDVELWMPCLPLFDPQLDVEMAKYVIANVGDRFCELVEQEKEAMSLVSPDVDIAWKRAVQGVREMCDVCDTTLFNIHWVCRKCGFVVCIDCYRMRTRRGGGCNDSKCPTCVEGGQRWLTCSANKQPHEPEKLMITQIIPSDVLWVLGRMIHEARDKWHISANCPCGRSTTSAITPKNGVSQQIMNTVSQSNKKSLVNGVGDEHGKGKRKTPVNDATSPMDALSLLADTAVSRESGSLNSKFNSKTKKFNSNSSSTNGPGTPESSTSQEEDGEKDGKSGQCSTLRDLLTRTNNGKAQAESRKPVVMTSTLEDIIQKVVEKNHPQSVSPKKITFTHYIPRSGISMQGRDSPIPQYNLAETSLQFPKTPHSWLDSGRLLRLLDPRHKNNLELFQQQWRRAQPVLVSACHNNLDDELWHPDAFKKDFGSQPNDLVNCSNHVTVIGHNMGAFWAGFENIGVRLKDDKDRPMILKLKDWPPTEDFSEMMPRRFQDLMNGLPLPEYTHRNGVYNLASRLPEFFVKPDLGPKMYNAYGTSLHPGVGSTNLHLDMSDAVNVMVYVGIPHDDKDNHEAAALRTLDTAGCCELTKKRVTEAGERPGALWHIYDPTDADKIREMLNRVATERGEKIESHHDPIHDQSWYLDEPLRERLLNEYGVQGYTILQCLGDAVFIPAGAPHQVRNLHSCIKCAEDFVSPENMNSCFKMTQEFRHLSDTHSNHEDKLQVKNIIYHAVKDAIAVLREHDE